MGTKNLRKGMKLNEKTIDKIIPYKVWYDKSNDTIQGKAPYYMVVADPDQELPLIIQRPDCIEEREVIMVVFKKGIKK